MKSLESMLAQCSVILKEQEVPHATIYYFNWFVLSALRGPYGLPDGLINRIGKIPKDNNKVVAAIGISTEEAKKIRHRYKNRIPTGPPAKVIRRWGALFLEYIRKEYEKKNA